MSLKHKLTALGLALTSATAAGCATTAPPAITEGEAVTNAYCISQKPITVTQGRQTQTFVVTEFNEACRDARNFMSAVMIYNENNITDQSRDNLGLNLLRHIALMRQQGNTAYLNEIDRQIIARSEGRENLENFLKRVEAEQPQFIRVLGPTRCADGSIGTSSMYVRSVRGQDTGTISTRTDCTAQPS